MWRCLVRDECALIPCLVMLDVAFEAIHSATDAELAYSDLEIILSLSAPVVR